MTGPGAGAVLGGAALPRHHAGPWESEMKGHSPGGGEGGAATNRSGTLMETLALGETPAAPAGPLEWPWRQAHLGFA